MILFCLKAQELGLNARPGDNRPTSRPHPLLSPHVSNSAMLAFQSGLYETRQGLLLQEQSAAQQKSAKSHEGCDAGGFLHTDATSGERRAGLDLYRPLTYEECLQLTTDTLKASDARMTFDSQLQHCADVRHCKQFLYCFDYVHKQNNCLCVSSVLSQAFVLCGRPN